MENTDSKTALGLDENIESMLCYSGWWITGIIFFVLETKSKTVKFHALQSIITFLPLFIFYYIFTVIPILDFIASILVGPFVIFLWVFLMYKSYKGEKFKVPVAGDIAEREVNK